VNGLGVLGYEVLVPFLSFLAHGVPIVAEVNAE
jgi:hypothetical protein